MDAGVTSRTLLLSQGYEPIKVIAWQRAITLMFLGKVEVLDGAFRVHPKDKGAAGGLARAVVELANREGWKLEMLRTEEGQLDEVFRRITLPDTVKQ